MVGVCWMKESEKVLFGDDQDWLGFDAKSVEPSGISVDEDVKWSVAVNKIVIISR